MIHQEECGLGSRSRPSGRWHEVAGEGEPKECVRQEQTITKMAQSGREGEAGSVCAPEADHHEDGTKW